MTERFLNNPVLISGAVEAVILAFVAFGLGWTGEQVAALMIAVTAVLNVLKHTLVTPVNNPDLEAGRGL